MPILTETKTAADLVTAEEKSRIDTAQADARKTAFFKQTTEKQDYAAVFGRALPVGISKIVVHNYGGPRGEGYITYCYRVDSRGAAECKAIVFGPEQERGHDWSPVEE